MKLAMIDDRLVPMESLDPIYLDRGLYFGDGVYEVLRSYNGKLFALDEHMQRFAGSMAAIRVSKPGTSAVPPLPTEDVSQRLGLTEMYAADGRVLHDSQP